MKKLTIQEFINNATKVHGHTYDYSLSEYINNQTKIKIICKKHGIFEQQPSNHIYKKYGCPSCSGVAKLDEKEYKKSQQNTL